MKHTVNLRVFGQRKKELPAESEETEELKEEGGAPDKSYSGARGLANALRLLPARPLLITLAFLILAFAAGSFVFQNLFYWRAVFLVNNQVYFGKLWYVPFWPTARLSDIYYLQVSQVQPGSSQDSSNIQIIKLGNEIHGPKDKMIIPVSQILFWEDLRKDSPVVKAIVGLKKR